MIFPNVCVHYLVQENFVVDHVTYQRINSNMTNHRKHSFVVVIITPLQRPNPWFVEQNNIVLG